MQTIGTFVPIVVWVVIIGGIVWGITKALKKRS
jgi:hypothetical protein